MESDRPPQLPIWVRGQQIKSGPFNVIVTDEMVRQRQRENEELARRWRREQERRRHLAAGSDAGYFGEFQEQKVRRRFIRRVFSILTVQLMFTALLIATFLFVQDVRDVVFNYPFLWIIAVGLFMFTHLAISCSDCARQPPCNVVFLIVLTLSLAFLTATLSVLYSTEAVLLAAGSTALVTLVITCISACTTFDLTKYAGTIVIVTLVGTLGMLMGIAMVILGLLHMSTMHLVIAMLGALLFSIWAFLDVQSIMGGRRISLDPEEVVFATAHLYVDIVMLYRYLLMFIGVK